jgi:hypothetical protein
VYLPTLKNARPVYRYQFGNYLGVVVTDCESIGMISYTHVLFVFEAGQQAPIFAVASEMSTMMLEMNPNARFLGVFDGSGHGNYGMSEDWLDLDKFTAKALEVAAAHFQVTQAPIKLPSADPRLN